MATSIKDVAQRAGVSVATVSRVFGNGPVSPELRERVEKAIAATGYRPNLSARRLRSQHSQTIGLMVADIRSPFFTALSRVVEDEAYRSGMRVILCNTDESADREAMYLRLMEEERVTGLIWAPTRGSLERLADDDLPFPVVLVDRGGPIGRHDSVVLDNHQATATLVRHLHAIGRSRVVGLFGNTSSTAVDRHLGYISTTASLGLSSEAFFVAPNADAAEREILKVFSRPDRPDGVIASSNLMLLGVVKAMRRLDLRTPDDVAIAGFDNETWSELVGPGLTVIEQPVGDIGRMAMTLLFDRLKTPKAPARKVMLSGRLIVRGSTAPVTGLVDEPVD
ncbi:HTH-type transcriptional regulator KdgR [Pleomorphomonas sp. T1.2MG-36]|uniref:LacI family DNA-binding transcriptional regulator n=1 Tax=Pleomorphomonas sp. T1.2MG-36 TaxID=3041167 RepID=UPI002477C10B|nr:LacI family DNA-binding transcriptional regulator [Pleomorphomonas sp. T1.2MG-36]CAI9405432.1 HTH-type transcriptional regulator KdgR [Pleomorphomonas sp. T1.2MG-36]